MKLNFLFSLSLILFFNCGFSQDSTKVLDLIHKQYYSEQNLILGGKSTYLMHEICFNVPGAKNASYGIQLTIVILDSTKAIKQKLLNLNTDTSILQTGFILTDYRPTNDREIMNHENDFSGSVKIISWQADGIEIEFDLLVVNHRINKAYKYYGRRKFIHAIHKKSCC